MKTRKLTEVLERVEAWPADVQNEFADFALELDAGLTDGEYQPSPEELAGIDRGLRAAAERSLRERRRGRSRARKIPRAMKVVYQR